MRRMDGQNRESGYNFIVEEVSIREAVATYINL